ncbi:MAG: hypothetical protein ACHQKZ_10640, partial [Solirubrobacterales bacterium]
MKRLLSGLSRFGLAVTAFLIVLAVARWGPVYAEPPFDVRALPLLGPAVLLAIVGVLTGRERRPRPVRPLLAAAGLALVTLGALVALRAPSGLSLDVSGPEGTLGRLAPAPVDVLGRDLRQFSGTRRWSLRWQGPLWIPEPGRYRLSVTGRGRVVVRLDGRPVLAAEGDALDAGVDLGLARGPVPLEVLLEYRGPAPRLRLGWRRAGRTETIPPRYLGEPGAAILWRATDLVAVALAGLVAALVLVVPWDRPRRPGAPTAPTVRELGVVAAGYAVLLIAMSWPLARDLAGTGPIDRPDGRLNAWILAWDAHALLHGPERLFQAPIFHPLPDALAFSENLLLPAVLAAPFALLGEPVLGYNLVLLLSLLVSGLGVYLLVRRVSADRLAAFVGGAAFAAGAHRWTRLAHLHAQVTLFLPFALLALDRFWQRRTLRRALLVGLMLGLQGLASVYLGAITASALAVAVLVALFGGLAARDLGRLAAGFLLAGVLLAPAVRPYLRMRAFQGVEFTLETISIYATTLTSYAASGTALWGPVSDRQLDTEAPDTLFPGIGLLTLGILGLAAAPRRYRAVALAASVFAMVFSLGPATGLYRFLHEHFVLVRGVRALSRFSLVPVLALSVLVGLALAGRRWFVSVAALVLMMIESSNLPLRLGTYEPPPAAARWLAGKEGAVVRLPLGEDDTGAMLDGIAHFRPLVNGDSGFMPRPYDRAMELLEHGPSEEALRFLRAVEVRHVLARVEWPLPLAADFPDGDRVYDVPSGPSAQVVEAAAPAAARFTPGGIELDLGVETVVGRVVFVLSDAAWIARPRVGLSRDGVGWDEVEGEASLADATLSLYRDPRSGRGEIRFPPRLVRRIRVPSGL